VLPKGRVAFSS